MEGGKPEEISELPISSHGFDISPDGKVAAFVSSSGGQSKLALVPVDSSQNAKLPDLRRPIPTGGTVRFTRDGKAVAYPFRDQDADNVWLPPAALNREEQ